MPTIKFLKRAELELFDACDWYEEQQKGLSLKFRALLKNTLAKIAKNPLHYPKRYTSKLRFTVLKNFPYVIVFWFDEKQNAVFTASIFHTSRSPDIFI
ncbi:MAG: type II toxin-antitoxin system RelE/ParE family toxin [Bacteroidota bacterium]